ncbi:MAG: LytTR family transcriptional regulator [Alistipes sp.]|nr:LytTR family transcriptional regulator [Alistipes sp.]
MASRLSAGREDGRAGMFFRQGNTFRRVDPGQIVYAEGMQNYVKLHLAGESIVIHQTMSSLEGILPAGSFYRIHRSYLVNVDHIATVSGNRVFIGGTELPVASQRMEGFLENVVLKKLISK